METKPIKKGSDIWKTAAMALPSDAEGVPIRIGDLMCSSGIREIGFKVRVRAVFEDGFVGFDDDNGFMGPFMADEWVHASADHDVECTSEEAFVDRIFAAMEGYHRDLTDSIVGEMLSDGTSVPMRTVDVSYWDEEYRRVARKIVSDILDWRKKAVERGDGECSRE